MARQDRYAGIRHCVDSRVARWLRPRVHQSGDTHSHVVKLQRGSVALVIHGRHNRSLSRLDAVEAGQTPGSLGQHDTGPVVRVEHQGLFDHARCDHNAPGTELDQPVRHQYSEQVVFIESERRRSGKNGHTIERRRLARQIRRSLIPRHGVSPMDGGGSAKVSSQSRGVVDQRDSGTISGSGNRSRHPGRASPDHGHVRMKALVQVTRLTGRVHIYPPQARHLPDDRLSQVPQDLGPVKRLVVETDRHQAVEPVQQRENVPVQRGPGVLVRDPGPGADRLHAGADVGYAVDVDETVWTAARYAQQAPATVVLEAAAEGPDSRRVERGP